ncbi:MAG: GrpB family protein [Candidatus Cloacimonetes bacterium]|nr:GrpB family protein [Candidatus Cloacimonadota bacterium]
MLVNHPDILKQYENLKTNLKSDFAQERKAYTQAKSDFIYSVLQKFGY